MEYRNGKLSRYLVTMVAFGANLFLPFQLFPFEKNELFSLIGLLVFLDIWVVYFCLQSTVIKIDGSEIRLIRAYYFNWIKSEETRINLNSIIKIKRVRGKRGGPTYSIYFQGTGNKTDKVTVTSWDIEDPEAMSEELSRRARVAITNSWFY